MRLPLTLPRHGPWPLLAFHELIPLCNQLWILLIHVWLYLRESITRKAFHANCISDSSKAAARVSRFISEERLQASILRLIFWLTLSGNVWLQITHYFAEKFF